MVMNMLTQFSDKIVNRLLAKGVISQEMREVYVYGFELLISSVFSSVLIIGIGLILHRFFETLAFLIAFVGVRGFTGGFHAKTYMMCCTVTMVIYVTVLVLAEFLPLPILGYWITGGIGIVTIILLAPVDHPNKRISPRKKKTNKTISVLLCILIIALGFLVRPYNTRVGSSLLYALLSDILLLVIK